MKTIIHPGTLLIILYIGLIPQTLSGQADGEALFQKRNCHACHTINGGKLIGPDLANITDLRDRQWLISFIKSPGKMISQGDTAAVRIFNEHNKVMMPDNNIPESDIEAIIDYIMVSSGNTQTSASQQPPETVSFSVSDVESGKNLFAGRDHFGKSGPSCITCHDIGNQNDFTGGNLAVDLTGSYEKLGLNGIRAILKNPAFPVMKAAYVHKPLTDEEIIHLTAYLSNVSAGGQAQKLQTSTTSYKLFFAGITGAVLFIIIISVIWRKRIRKGIHDNIFHRQIETF